MDTDTSPAPRMPSNAGGVVEPVNRAAVAKERFQTPPDAAGIRYEVRDPFAEVTYHADSFRDIVAQADRVGSARVLEVAEDGTRTPIHRVDGTWQRWQPLPARPERPLDPGPARDEVPTAMHGDPLRDSSDRPGRIKPAQGVKQDDPAAETTHSSAGPVRSDAKAAPQIEARAEREARASRLHADLADRYVVKKAPVKVGDVHVGRTEYRYRGDTSRVAFTESTFRLSTDTNSPSVARSMVDLAEARNWKALRVDGHDDFKRLVWLEASVRGVKAVGYEPSRTDLELLGRERESRQVNRIEPDRQADAGASTSTTTSTTTGKSSARGGGRKAVLAAIEAVLVAKGVPAIKRTAVMEAATEKLAQRMRDGQTPKVKVYDKAAPSQRNVTVPTPEVQRSRDRATPAPAR